MIDRAVADPGDFLTRAVRWYPRGMRTLLLALSLVGCAPAASDLVLDAPDASPEVFTVWEGGSSVVVLDDGRAITTDGTDLVLIDPRIGGPLTLDAPGAGVRGAATLGDDLLLASEAGLFVYDGIAWDSPLQASLGGPPERLVADGDILWFFDGDSWLRHADDHLQQIIVDGGEQAPLLAVGGAYTWMGVRGELPAVVGLDGSEPIEITGFSDVRSVAVDASGAAWVADGIQVHRRAAGGSWVAYTLESGAAEVAAHPKHERIWIRTADGAYTGTSEGVVAAVVPEGRWLQVDDLGRLWIAGEDDVRVVALDRPVTLRDLPTSAIDAPTDIVVDPTHPETVTSVTLSLDGEALPDGALAGPPWAWTALPASLIQGTHTLEATVTWDDGKTSTVTGNLEVGDGRVTWDSHVQRLAEDRCLACHGGDSETVLTSPEDWESRFELILELVRAGSMPLGQDTLPQSEIATLEAWQVGGFE